MTNPLRVTPVRYRAAKRRVRERLKPETHGVEWQGRWALVQRSAVLGKPMSDEERAEMLARILLARYGVLTRDCLDREELPLDWGVLYPQLQRMEMRGEVRRGYFVAGLSGVQFALPDAVEKLRAAASSRDDTLVVLNATDPVNLFGSELPDVPLRFARLPSAHVVLWRGRPVLVGEDNGKQIMTTNNADADIVERALQAYLARPHAPRHAIVLEWNGEAVLRSAGEARLKALGFSRAPSGMEKWLR